MARIQANLSYFLSSRVFHVSVEVLTDQLLEENAESSGPPVVEFVYFSPYEILGFISQRDHYFSHGSSRLLKVA
jgi:hypothetical protein